MNAHPEPDGLSDIKLPITEVKGPWYRVHEKAYGPLYFGKSQRNRFDCPSGSFGVLYLSQKLEGAFIETFGHETGNRFVQMSELETRAYSIVESSRPLRLVDLRGPGLARIGADGRLCAGDRNLAGRWSSGFYNHADKPDGIYFRARHDLDEMCSAVFHRVEPLLNVVETVGLSDDSILLRMVELLEHYDFGIYPS